MDDGADVKRNVETFSAVADALADGDSVCLFPEGISHSSGRLEPLRTGAARMAIGAEGAGTRVALVAVGLNFDRKTMFRSRVTVVYGPPFFATDLMPSPAAGDHAAVKALTERISERMRGLLIEADPKADQALVDRVDRLYAAARGRPSDPAERVERRRVIAAGIERLRTDQPDRDDTVLMQLRRYDDRLRRFGLRDRHLDWNVSNREAAAFGAREVVLAIVLLPLCALGFVLYFVPYQLTGFAARLTTKESDVFATAQVFTGAAIYAAWFGLIAAVAWWKLGGDRRADHGPCAACACGCRARGHRTRVRSARRRHAPGSCSGARAPPPAIGCGGAGPSWPTSWTTCTTGWRARGAASEPGDSARPCWYHRRVRPTHAIVRARGRRLLDRPCRR